MIRMFFLKVHKLFALLNLSHAYVTSLGRLVGVVALTEVHFVCLALHILIVTKYYNILLLTT